MVAAQKKKLKRVFRKIYPHNKTSESVLLGILLAIVGGILEVYTFIGRGGVFCNAQTGNVALLGISIARRQWDDTLIYIPPIAAFILGVFVAETVKNWKFKFIKEPARAVLILEAIILFFIGLVPDTVPNMFVTVTISFVASVQVSAFRTLEGAPYATTMLTGNLRSASHATFIAITEKNSEAAARAIRYVTIILSFLFGTIFGNIVMAFIGIKAIWCAVFLLICCFTLDYFY